MNSPVHQHRREPISRESLVYRRSPPAMKMALFRRSTGPNKDPTVHRRTSRWAAFPHDLHENCTS